jgi:hypothetical protein
LNHLLCIMPETTTLMLIQYCQDCAGHGLYLWGKLKL